eukprot:TRINITY_DN5360_c0_g1_i12.p1 TRINITY_DN5360_c0_g1~~TRINITY_DN5360_c0_g1_i12.p1  ORF type:complete len:275 (-),score=50.35 TRINITY_DN5360_c0_g1_i12:16-795(-)
MCIRDSPKTPKPLTRVRRTHHNKESRTTISLTHNMVSAASKDHSFASTASSSSKDSSYFPPPLATAYAWSVYSDSGDLLWAKNPSERMEVASLVKVMTCFTVLKVFGLVKGDLNATVFGVSGKAMAAIGTSASLIAGDKLKVSDLLYGMMLPSGNDAAVCLAEGCGEMLINSLTKDKAMRNKVKKALSITLVKELKPVEVFVRYMNRLVYKFGLSDSSFGNPNGLADKKNKTTVKNLSLIHICRCRRYAVCRSRWSPYH